MIGLLIAAAAPISVVAHVTNPTSSEVSAMQAVVVPNSGGVTTVRTSSPVLTKQKVQIYPGVSKATTGSKLLSMNRIVMPAGMKGLRHMHRDAETVLFVIEGNPRTLIGLNGEVVADHQPGDFIFIPPNVWHQPVNVTNSPAIVIEARSDADDQANVILEPSIN